MTCPSCEGSGRALLDDRGGTDMGDCRACCCVHCGEKLLGGKCICDEALRLRHSTAEQWIEAAGDMHFGSIVSPTVGLRNRYRKARTFCELKAFDLAGVGCTADALRAALRRADVLAMFEHLMAPEAA